jgi:hypothetical protein
MGSGKHNLKKGKDWDSSIPDKSYFEELQRVSANHLGITLNYHKITIGLYGIN